MAHQAGAWHRPRYDRRASRGRQTLQCRPGRLRRGLSLDEPGRRHPSGTGAHWAARALPSASARWRGATLSRLHAGAERVMEGLKRGGAAIVGVAESDLGQGGGGLSVIGLMAQGTGRALDDCGLSLQGVDGLVSATTPGRLLVLAV